MIVFISPKRTGRVPPAGRKLERRPGWRRRVLGVLALAWLCVAGGMAAAQTVPADVREERMQVGREERSYLIARPATLKGPAPVVIALHAAGQSSDSFKDYLGLDASAMPRGVVTVYPQGIGRVWNDGRPAAMRLKAMLTPGDDVPFLVLLAQRLVEEGIADPRRIYLLGISNGGFMVERMACEHADLFAAFAVTMATAPANYREECAPSRPVPIMFVHGTADSVIGWMGFWTPIGATLSAPDSALLFAGLNRCTQDQAEGLEQKDPRDATRITLQTWSGCEGGSEVRLYRVDGGGHQSPARVPTKPDLLSGILGLRSRQMDMGEVSLAFFSRYALPGPQVAEAPPAAPKRSGAQKEARKPTTAAAVQRGSRTQ